MKKTADVIIIGGGINGCATAYYLAKRGIKDVLVLEADDSIGHGGSSRNGGGCPSFNEQNDLSSPNGKNDFKRTDLPCV